jgi:protein NirF
MRFTYLFICLLYSQISLAELRGTGDLGLIIEREPAAVQIISTSTQTSLSHITGLGDLSHASVVYSRDARYAFIFGRDGGLSKIDLLKNKIDKRIIQAGNSIGGAISQDGKLIAVSNYQPGGVKVFSSETLELIADIPATYAPNKRSKVVGLVDAPGQKFIFSLFDANEIWILDLQEPQKPKIQKFSNIGKQPYDALLSPDGRYYIAGLFADNGLALLDLWSPEKGVKRILPDYGKQDEKLPVYKMPHLEGWAAAGNLMFIPAIGQHEVLVIEQSTWQLIKRIPVLGQPVFVMARPDGRQVWVNCAFPDNGNLQVIDVKDLSVKKHLQPGKAVLHMEFTPRGEHVWVSARDDNRVLIYDTQSFKEIKRLPAKKPSGIFFSSRAHKMGL